MVLLKYPSFLFVMRIFIACLGDVNVKSAGMWLLFNLNMRSRWRIRSPSFVFFTKKLDHASRGEQVGLTAEPHADTLRKDSSTGKSIARTILGVHYATWHKPWNTKKHNQHIAPMWSSPGALAKAMVKRAELYGVYSRRTHVQVWFPEY